MEKPHNRSQVGCDLRWRCVGALVHTKRRIPLGEIIPFSCRVNLPRKIEHQLSMWRYSALDQMVSHSIPNVVSHFMVHPYRKKLWEGGRVMQGRNKIIHCSRKHATIGATSASTKAPRTTLSSLTTRSALPEGRPQHSRRPVIAADKLVPSLVRIMSSLSSWVSTSCESFHPENSTQGWTLLAREIPHLMSTFDIGRNKISCRSYPIIFQRTFQECSVHVILASKRLQKTVEVHTSMVIKI